MKHKNIQIALIVNYANDPHTIPIHRNSHTKMEIFENIRKYDGTDSFGWKIRLNSIDVILIGLKSVLNTAT